MQISPGKPLLTHPHTRPPFCQTHQVWEMKFGVMDGKQGSYQLERHEWVCLESVSVTPAEGLAMSKKGYLGPGMWCRWKKEHCWV